MNPETMVPQLSIYAASAYDAARQAGGWCALVVSNTKAERVLTGSEGETTNNRMVLRAALYGMMPLKSMCRIVLVSDSQYLVRGLNEWLPAWRDCRFEGVKNPDLWGLIDLVSGTHDVHSVWMPKKTQDFSMTRAVRLAQQACR